MIMAVKQCSVIFLTAATPKHPARIHGLIPELQPIKFIIVAMPDSASVFISLCVSILNLINISFYTIIRLK